MYTILCQDKSLIITQRTACIYQNDNRVDIIRFLVKPMYDDIDLSKYTVMAQFTLPKENEGALEVLSFNDELYKGYMLCEYTLTNVLTQYIGNVNVSLYISYYSAEENKTYVMNTNSVAIEVLAHSFTGESIGTEESMDILTQLQTQIKALQTEKLDTQIIYDETNGEIQFYADDEEVGSPIRVDNEITWIEE